MSEPSDYILKRATRLRNQRRVVFIDAYHALVVGGSDDYWLHKTHRGGWHCECAHQPRKSAPICCHIQAVMDSSLDGPEGQRKLATALRRLPLKDRSERNRGQQGTPEPSQADLDNFEFLRKAADF